MVWSPSMESDLLRRVFPGESEVAARLRQLDWTSNDLGTPDTWPQTLQTAIAICLASRIPMQVWWGPGRSLIYNDAAIELLGTRHPSVLARSGREGWSDEVWNVIGPAIDRVYATGETEWCEGIRMLLARRVPHEETYMTFSFAAIAGESGRVDGVFASCVEVTENVVSHRRMSLLHRLGVGVASARGVDATVKTIDKLLQSSPDVPFAALYLVENGVARAHSFIGITQAESGLPETITDGALARVMESEDAVELTTPHPASRPALAMPMRGGGNGLVGILVCGHNPQLPLDESYRSFLELITAHVNSAIIDSGDAVPTPSPAQLAAPQLRSRDAFLSVVAHELRNPLSALMTTLQALMLRAPSEDVELMERSVRQLSRIVDNLLDVSRIARGRLELRPKPTELANIIDRAMELVTPMFNERNTQVFVRVPRVGLRIDVDPERIAQAIANLLANASRYSEPASRVWVQAARELDRVKLVIKDEGTGIEPDRLPVIFEAFYQPPETRPRTSGLGLGLAIARSLVELHGGTLEITSGGTGQGTECVVEVPTAARVGAPAATAQAPASRRKLLLVEDNDDTARSLKNALEQLGYVVALAHNGPVALNVARTFDPDVVLMDIGLPVMDGWELAKRLRELRGVTHNAPVVAVTAYDRDVDKQRSTEAGFAEHLVKPIDLRKLQEVVESLPMRTSSTPS
jgi:signal transduction histidine kinase/ActR/RegA family two-component response regulator